MVRTFFLWLNNLVFKNIYYIRLIHTSIYQHLDFFCVLALMSNTAMDMLIQVAFCDCFLYF